MEFFFRVDIKACVYVYKDYEATERPNKGNDFNCKLISKQCYEVCQQSYNKHCIFLQNKTSQTCPGVSLIRSSSRVPVYASRMAL